MPLLQSTSPSSAKDFSSYRVISIQALCNIFLEEELLLCSGSKYKFHGRERL